MFVILPSSISLLVQWISAYWIRGLLSPQCMVYSWMGDLCPRYPLVVLVFYGCLTLHQSPSHIAVRHLWWLWCPPVMSLKLWRHPRMPLQLFSFGFFWILISWRCWSKWGRKGLRHTVNSAILNGHPWRIEQCIGMGLDIFPFTWTTENTSVYVYFILSMKPLLKP